MNSIFFGLITLAILVLVGFIIYFLHELKKTLNSLMQYMETTEATLKSTTEELQMTLRSVRRITDDVGVVADDARMFSGSIRSIGESVKRVSGVLSIASTACVLQTSGIAAGVKAGLEYFLRNLLRRER